MDRIWGFVLETSIYASILGMAIFLIKVILKDKISGKWSYLLWMLLVIKLVMPIGPRSELSIFNKFDLSKINSDIVDSNIDIVSNKYEANSYINGNENISNEYIEKELNDILEENNTNNISNAQNENDKDTFKVNAIPLIWMSGFIISLFLFI
ncbi:MAG: M56 family metallopeptidase, partial [Peptostreptococcaceae bacterium]